MAWGMLLEAHLRGLPCDNVVQVLLLPELHVLQEHSRSYRILQEPEDTRLGPSAHSHQDPTTVPRLSGRGDRRWAGGTWV